MYNEQTYDDYLRDQELLGDLARAFGYTENNEEMERCEMCGERYLVEDFDTYNEQRMCVECVELERINDAAEALRPDFSKLFNEMQQAVTQLT